MELEITIEKKRTVTAVIDLEEWNTYSKLSYKEKHIYVQELLSDPDRTLLDIDENLIKDDHGSTKITDWALREPTEED